MRAEQEGLVEHYGQLAKATSLSIVVYQRDNVILTPETAARLAAIDSCLGVKDGLGDWPLLEQQRKSAPEGFRIVGGLPTAELDAERYRALGATGYSSAVLNFLPELAVTFRRALDEGRTDSVRRLLREFFEPFARLRDQVGGYAVTLVKAAVGLRFGPVGEPRAPLLAPTPEHLEELQRLIVVGLNLANDENRAG